jgi:hypothetical protein
MDDVNKKKVPVIILLRTEDYLNAWKRSVDNVFRFYGTHDLISQEGPGSRKRPFKDVSHANFLLGLLSASVSPVAHRLVKAGWDFSDTKQDPHELYKHVLQVIIPLTQVFEAVADILKALMRSAPTAPSAVSLGIYQRRLKDYRNRLDALGCPMNDEMAIYLVLNALKKDWPELVQDLTEGVKDVGDLTWNKVMDKIAAAGLHI